MPKHVEYLFYLGKKMGISESIYSVRVVRPGFVIYLLKQTLNKLYKRNAIAYGITLNTNMMKLHYTRWTFGKHLSTCYANLSTDVLVTMLIICCLLVLCTILSGVHQLHYNEFVFYIVSFCSFFLCYFRTWFTSHFQPVAFSVIVQPG